jgi:hypothetical protein
MQTSSVIDVAFGLATIFLIFSLLVSGANELISTVLNERSAFLFRGLKQLLENEDEKGTLNGYTALQTDSAGSASPLAVEKVLTHPLAWPSLTPTIRKSNDTKHPPSYLSPKTFGAVAVDLLVGSESRAAARDRISAWATQLPSTDPLKSQVLTATADRSQPIDVQLAALHTLSEAKEPTPSQQQLTDLLSDVPSSIEPERPPRPSRSRFAPRWSRSSTTRTATSTSSGPGSAGGTTPRWTASAVGTSGGSTSCRSSSASRSRSRSTSTR